MKCKKARRLLSEYLDNDLDKATGKQVQQHLSDCDACRNEFLGLRTTKETVGQIEPLSAPEDFLFQVHKKILQESGSKKILKILTWPFRIRLPFQFATATALTVLLVVWINVKFSESPLHMAPKKQEKLEQVDSMDTPGMPKIETVSDKDAGDKATPVKKEAVPPSAMSQSTPAPLGERSVTAPVAEKMAYAPKADSGDRENIPAAIVGASDLEEMKQPSVVEWVLKIRPSETLQPEPDIKTRNKKRYPLFVPMQKMREGGMEENTMEHLRESEEIESKSSSVNAEKELSEIKGERLRSDTGEMNQWMVMIRTAAEKFGGRSISIKKVDGDAEDMSHSTHLIEMEMPLENQKAFYEELSMTEQFKMQKAISPDKWGMTSFIRIRLVH